MYFIKIQVHVVKHVLWGICVLHVDGLMFVFAAFANVVRVSLEVLRPFHATKDTSSGGLFSRVWSYLKGYFAAHNDADEGSDHSF